MHTFISKKSILSAISVVREDLKRKKKNSKSVNPTAVLSVLRSRIFGSFDESEAISRISRYI